MNKLILTPLLFALASTSAYANKPVSLKQAIAAQKVLVSAYGTGGYLGKCLKVDITNISCETMKLDIDPALIFKPADTSYQNLVVVGDESMELQPGEQKDITLQTFCGKSYAHCPAVGERFSLWKQGDSILIKTVRFIKENQFYNFLGQSAVWTITNSKCISTIYDPADAENAKKFIAFEAGMRKLPMPDYYSYYHIDTSHHAAACVSENGKQYVDLSFKDGEARNVYIVVLDDKGQPYDRKPIFEKIVDGVHTVTFQFDATTDRAGLYCVMLRKDNNEMMSNKVVRVGSDWCD